MSFLTKPSKLQECETIQHHIFDDSLCVHSFVKTAFVCRQPPYVGVTDCDRIQECVLEYLRSICPMFDVYHEDGWSGDPSYHDWDRLETVDSDIEHSVGGNTTKGEDSIVSVDIHDYILQAAEECELFRQWQANNNHLTIHCQFRDHLVLLRAANISPYGPLPFPEDNDDDLDSIHH